MTNAEKYKTAKERLKALDKWCDSGVRQGSYGKCLASGCIACALKWLELEAEEEKPLPCPFCGGEVDVISTSEINIVSCAKGCGYYSKSSESKESAIAAHNRIARAVRSAEKRKEN